MSSSDSEDASRNSGRNYVINLQAFSDTRTKLETELRNKSKTADLLDTYCSQQHSFDNTNPFVAPDGAFPLLLEIYDIANDDSTPKIQSCWGVLTLTDTGKKLQQLIGSMDPGTTVDYGEHGPSGVLASPEQMHHRPKLAWQSLRQFWILHTSTDVWTKKAFGALNKRVRRWLSHNHHIWATLVMRTTPSDSTKITDGLEMSHGVKAYSQLLTKYRHTHAR